MRTIYCPSCGESLKAPDELKARKVRCTACGATFVPPETSASPSPRQAGTPAQVAQAGRSAAPAGSGKKQANPKASPASSSSSGASDRHPPPHRPRRGSPVQATLAAVGAVLLVLAIIGAYWVVTHPVRRYVDANGQVVVRRMGQAEWARIEPMLNEKGEWVGEGESPGAGEGSPAEARTQRQRPGDDRAATPAPSRPADRVPAPGEALVVGDRRVRVPTAALDVDPLSRRWHVIGTVWNAGDHPLASLRLQVEVVDASGARWGEVPQAVELRYLPVGGSVPFSTPVTGLDPDEKYGFRVTVLDAEADPTLVCVLLENYSVEPDKEGRNVVLTVEGEARNPTGAAMAGPMVYCTFYDQRGIALGSRTGSLPDTPQRLAPGATAPFRVRYDTGMRFMPGTISALPRLVGRRGS